MTKLQWEKTGFIGGDGVLTGCDESYEWMLKWFWKHYSKTNTLPITFLDFGISKSARIWCEKRMHVIPCRVSGTLEKDTLSFPLPNQWPKERRELRLRQRKFWFTKICSLLKTPYSRSLWIDIDCKFLEKINDIFDLSDNPHGIALSIDPTALLAWKEYGLLKPNAKGYLAGFILFKRNSSLIEKWVLGCQRKYSLEYSEQSLINSIIEEEGLDIPLVPKKYHWLNLDVIPEGVKIVHYHCISNKGLLINEINSTK